MSTSYQFWMTYNGGTEKLMFPVLPDEIMFTEAGTSSVVNIQGLGEVVVMGDPAATEISWSCFFPATEFYGMKAVTQGTPEQVCAKITQWKNSDKPVQFNITGTGVNGYFTIQHFFHSERAGDVGTRWYDITLKLYRETSTRQVVVDVPAQRAYVPPSAPIPTRVDNRVTPSTYTVVKGDSLSKIAQSQLGSSSRWREIYELNKAVIGGNPNLIFPGQVYQLPT